MEITKRYNKTFKWCEWCNSQNQLHREDGPAIEFTNGYVEYWEHGERIYTEAERNRMRQEQENQEMLSKENESKLL